jgi:hypothetical protein
VGAEAAATDTATKETATGAAADVRGGSSLQEPPSTSATGAWCEAAAAGLEVAMADTATKGATKKGA